MTTTVDHNKGGEVVGSASGVGGGLRALSGTAAGMAGWRTSQHQTYPA